MDVLPLVFSSGWASGVNAYAVVLVMGLFGRFAGVDAVPPALTQVDVLLAAGVMYGVEFVTDKVPYLDSAWDTVSTAIRPTVGAILGVLIAGEAGSLNQAVYGVVGGGTALASHLVKGSIRLAVNSSPEPVTNSVVSVAEDFSVAGVISLALYHPWVALGVSAVLLVLGIIVVFVLLRYVRRGWQRWKGRRPANPAPG
ncbi:MAG TPA: DUF4126 domain-containing protein [Nocardioidaceae bacterium]|jgi:hypothetical protein|nr:DUF4126 domain-containing protein [Nocardioidaceae bacterium]